MADFEAGLGTLSRMEAGQVDVVLVIAEPTAKSMQVARRALDMIAERKVGRAMLVANRLASDADRELIARTFPDETGTMVPDDPAIRAADAQGTAPFDTAPDAPAVRTLRSLAESLVA